MFVDAKASTHARPCTLHTLKNELQILMQQLLFDVRLTQQIQSASQICPIVVQFLQCPLKFWLLSTSFRWSKKSIHVSLIRIQNKYLIRKKSKRKVKSDENKTNDKITGQMPQFMQLNVLFLFSFMLKLILHWNHVLNEQLFVCCFDWYTTICRYAVCFHLLTLIRCRRCRRRRRV